MITESTERDLAREAAIRAMLPLAGEHGWTVAAARLAGVATPEILFPDGPAEMVQAYIAMADREMVEAAAPTLPMQKLSQRVRSLILARLNQAEIHKAAIRRGLTVLARPGNLATAARCTAGTVEAIWTAAGDTSADFSWYTKRAILASVYTATLLYWLAGSRTTAETESFLDRRLAGVAELGRARARLSRLLAPG